MNIMRPDAGQCPYAFLSEVVWELGSAAGDRWVEAQNAGDDDLQYYWWKIMRNAETLEGYFSDLSHEIYDLKAGHSEWSYEQDGTDY